ncbi:MAG: hypothetical protein ACI976_001134 [Aureispira sp.]
MLFIIGIPLGVYHIAQTKWNSQYHIPMCDCDKEDDRTNRVGAICKDRIKSYATGRYGVKNGNANVTNYKNKIVLNPLS